MADMKYPVINHTKKVVVAGFQTRRMSVRTEADIFFHMRRGSYDG